jgi:prepilin-type N-terminal cleavage/methylation domain-containing protein/prepilin-type processing-associated H-X9-DG protein
MRRNAFTLVELLVVIAIICLLVTILMPSFSRAKQSARRMICVSHFSAIGSGVAGYIADNNEVMVPTAGWAVVSPVKVETTGNAPRGMPGALDHSWSPGWYTWFWADFLVSYFDTEAKPTRTMDADCCYASVLAQPEDGNYAEFSTDSGCGLVMSKRLNCPDQPRTVTFQSHYPHGGIYGAHYMMFTGADGSMGYGGDMWTIPNDGNPNHANPLPEPQPCPPPPHRASNYAMDRVILVGEPNIACANNDCPISMEVYRYAQTIYNALPHEYNGDQAGNFMFMDGHVDTLSRTAIKSWADQFYITEFGGTAPAWGNPYPFLLSHF